MTEISQWKSEGRIRSHIKHILQYLAATWNWCLTITPHEHVRDLTLVSDASLAPGGGRSHEGVT
eukprot:7143092-Prorocentrum_lima.AAC.1